MCEARAQRREPAAIGEARQALINNDVARAESLLEELMKARPSADACNLLGVVRDQQNRAAEAEELYLRALKLNPALLSARNNLANNYLKRGRAEDAIKQLKLVVQSDRDHAEANFNLGLVYAKQGQFKLAITHLERTRKQAGAQLQVLFLLLESYAAAKDEAGTVRIAAEIFKLPDEDGRIHFTAGLVLARSGLYERAAEAFRYTVERQPKAFEAYYNLGLALYNIDKLEEAEKALAAAADINPDEADVHYRLGLVFSARGDLKGAVEEFKHTVERNPKHHEAYFLMGEEYFKRDAVTPAYNAYLKAVELAPDKAVYHIRLGNVCFKLFKYARAEEAYRKVLELSDPKQIEVHYLIGYALRSQGKLAEAIPLFQKELEYHPKHTDSFANLGFAHLELGNFAEAEKSLRAALALNDNNSEAHFDLGRLMVRQKRYEEGISELTRAITLKPDYTQAHYQLFLAYTRTSQKEKADKELAIFQKLEEEDKRERDERERRQREVTQ